MPPPLKNRNNNNVLHSVIKESQLKSTSTTTCTRFNFLFGCVNVLRKERTWVSTIFMYDQNYVGSGVALICGSRFFHQLVVPGNISSWSTSLSLKGIHTRVGSMRKVHTRVVFHSIVCTSQFNLTSRHRFDSGKVGERRKKNVLCLFVRARRLLPCTMERLSSFSIIIIFRQPTRMRNICLCCCLKGDVMQGFVVV